MNRNTLYELAKAAKTAVLELMNDFDCWDDERILKEVNIKARELKAANVVSGIRRLDYKVAIKLVLIMGARESYNVDDEVYYYTDWLDAIEDYAFDMPPTVEVIDQLKDYFNVE